MRTRVMTIAAAAVLAAGVWSVQANTEKAGQEEASSKNGSPKTAAIGAEAPDFALVGVDGKEYRLSQFRGKHVVIEWINFDCPFVAAQYNSGNMQGLQKKYTGKDVVWLSVCSSAKGKQGHFEGETLRGRIEQAGWKGTAYLIDAEGAVGKMYEAKTTPHMFVVNPEGVLVYAGAIDSQPTTDAAVISKSTNYVAGALDASMTGKAVATATSQPYGCGVKYKQ